MMVFWYTGWTGIVVRVVVAEFRLLALRSVNIPLQARTGTTFHITSVLAYTKIYLLILNMIHSSVMNIILSAKTVRRANESA